MVRGRSRKYDTGVAEALRSGLGSLLKKSIPIRTFADLAGGQARFYRDRPGGSLRGEYGGFLPEYALCGRRGQWLVGMPASSGVKARCGYVRRYTGCDSDSSSFSLVWIRITAASSLTSTSIPTAARRR